MKTAGMVNGTPDWQLDRMIEIEADKQWEEQQPKETAKRLDDYGFDDFNEAHADLVVVLSSIGRKYGGALKYIEQAIDAIKGTPEADKMTELYDAICDIRYEFKQISELLHNKMFPKEEKTA